MASDNRHSQGHSQSILSLRSVECIYEREPKNVQKLDAFSVKVKLLRTNKILMHNHHKT